MELLREEWSVECVMRLVSSVSRMSVRTSLNALTLNALRLSNKYATNAACSRKSGTITSAPAWMRRVRFHSSMPARSASLVATPTPMPPTRTVSSISTKPSPNATNSGPDSACSAMMRSISSFLEKAL